MGTSYLPTVGMPTNQQMLTEQQFILPNITAIYFTNSTAIDFLLDLNDYFGVNANANVLKIEFGKHWYFNYPKDLGFQLNVLLYSFFINEPRLQN